MTPRTWLVTYAVAAITLAAVAFACPSVAAAAALRQTSDAITLLAADSGRRDVAPGERVTAAFIATNNTTNRVDVVRATELPPHWRMLAGASQLSLAPRSREVVLVSLAVPATARPGPHSVTLRLTGPDGTSVATVVLRVRERRDVRIAVVAAPEIVPAGDDYTITYDVTNHGNVRSHLRLEVTPSRDARVTLEPAELQLNAGESRVVTARVSTSEALQWLATQRLRIRVEAVDGLAMDTASRLTAVSRVDVIPRASEQGERSHTVPFALTLRNTQASGPGWTTLPGAANRSLELSGSGRLAPGSDTRVSVMVNTGGSARGFLGEHRDEYRLAVNSRSFDVRLGDGIHSLSPLTQPGRYGFGGGGRVTAGRFTAGGFSHSNRFIPGSDTEQGAFAAMRVGARSEVRVNRLQRSGHEPATVSSVHARMSLPISASADMEYATGSGNRGSGSAWTGQLRGRAGWAAYDVRHVHTDSAFTGGIAAGVDESRAHLSVTPWRRLWFRASYTDREAHTPVISFLTAATEQRRHFTTQKAAAGYGAFGLEHELVTRERTLPAATTASQELIRLRLGARFGRLQLRGSVEEGSTRLTADGDAQPFQRLTGASTLTFGNGSYSLFADRTTGQTLYSGNVSDRLQGGATATIKAGDKTELRLAVNGYRLVHVDVQSRGSVDFTVTQRLLFNHSLSLRGRSTAESTRGFDRNVFEVSYRIPFGMPVRRAMSTGRVETRIYDAATGAPIRDALVRLGSKLVLTDPKGRAVFTGVSSDSAHLIQLDRRGASGARIAVADQPLEVRVSPGRTVSVDIPLAPAGRIEGRVIRFATQGSAVTADGAGQSMVRMDSVPRLVVALSNGVQDRRRTTGADGAFEFTDVQPGNWTLRVVDGSLPDQHVVADSIVPLTIGGGDTARAELHIVPRRRTVRMISAETVSAGVAPADRTVRSARAAAAATPVAARVVLDAPILPARGSVPQLSELAASAPAGYRRPAFTPPTQADLDAVRGQHETVRAVEEPTVTGETVTLPSLFVASTGRTWYRVGPRDRSLMSVARAVYGDERLWPKIWLSNRRSAADPANIGNTRRLLIPAKAPLTAEEISARDEYLRSQLPVRDPASGLSR